MNKTLAIISLFVMSLAFAEKADASQNGNNPWDPRGKEVGTPGDDSGKEAIPEPESSEQESNNE
jgi:hypothetical protein